MSVPKKVFTVAQIRKPGRQWRGNSSRWGLGAVKNAARISVITINAASKPKIMYKAVIFFSPFRKKQP